MENNKQNIKCDECKNVVYTWAKDYKMSKCMICDTIIQFRWNSIWKRIKSII